MIFRKRDIYILGVFLLGIFILIFIIINPILSVDKIKINFIKSDTSALQKHVEFLSQLNPGRNYLNKNSINTSSEYIKNNFAQYCELVEEQIFTVDKKEYKNIICSFNIDKKERLIIGAHYDTYLDLPGADDNASGIAGLLELARMLSINDIPTNDRIDIVAYNLEEPPFFSTNSMGSFYHASMLRKENVILKSVIILEMIGYYSDEQNSQSFPFLFLKPFYPNQANFIAIISKFGQNKDVRFIKKKFLEVMEMKTYSLNGPSFLEGVDYSDHLSYWKNNYNAVMITDTSFYRNKNYHTKNDTSDTLDYKRMAEVVNGVYWAVINMDN